MRLTAAAVEKIKPPPTGQVEYFDQHLPSFGLRVSYKGSKSWFLMTRVEGKLIRMTLGKAPAIPLAEARNEGRRLINLAATGKDPRLEKVEAKREREERHRNTFDVCADEFLERYVAKRLRPSTMREYKRILTGADTHHWQGRPVSSIGKREALDVIEKIDGRGSPGAAARALAYLRKFFGWCAEHDIIDVAPTEGIRPPHQTKKRDRVLDDDELRYVIRALRGDNSIFRDVFQLALLTGQRRSEVAGMRWSELRDLDNENPIWEIPGERTKNKLVHLVPLPSEVADLIRFFPKTGDLVFTTTGRTPVSGFGKAKERLDEHINRLREADGLEPMGHWTLHDLRRTMVTMMNEKLGIAPHVVEAVVNHVSGLAKAGVAGVYNRALYLDDRRRALNLWSRHLMKLPSP